MEEKKTKKKLTLTISSTKPYNVPHYKRDKGKTSVVVEKKAPRRWGEKKIKTLKDFAELSADELLGCYDEKKGKRFKVEGYLEEFALSKNEADDLIMNARNIVYKQGI